MKIVVALFVLTAVSAFIGDNSVSKPYKNMDIQRQIDSFNIQTHINQELFKIRINKLSNPKI